MGIWGILGVGVLSFLFNGIRVSSTSLLVLPHCVCFFGGRVKGCVMQ